ncbi:MAG: hypothetical protein O3C57_02235 [Verrucomicrobia bacterium]|nr:hypothetical protein [Verrucomicrobiota bacterium]
MNNFSYRLTHALVLVAVMQTGALRAAYLESDSSGEVRPAPPTQEALPPGNDIARRAGDAVSVLVSQLRVGRPFTYQGLTVFPLTHPSPVRQDDMVTFETAMRNDWIIVRERGRATVGQLDFVNTGPHHVLLRAYALEYLPLDPALDLAARRPVGRVTPEDVERFINRAHRTRREVLASPGTGELLRLTGEVSGSALIWKRHVVHMTLWP